LDYEQEGDSPEHGDEGDEYAVVAFAHTGADPGAVVVELLDAGVALKAVGGAGRTVDEAGGAELEFEHVGLDGSDEDVLAVGHAARSVVTADRYGLLLLFFELPQYLGYDPGVASPEYDECDLEADVQQDGEHEQGKWGLPGADHVVEDHDEPGEQVGAQVLEGLGEEELAAGVVVVVVGDVGDLVGFEVLGAGPFIFLRHMML